jgi:hypothetical protein
LFKLAELHHMPLAIEAVRQIDAIFAAEATINGKPAAERLAVRQRDIAPLVAALGRKAWLFAGSDQGGERAAAMYSLIQTAKLNGIDPRAWLADVLARIADMPQQRLHELLPWNWKKQQNMAPSAA